jgi:hypothetical protein
LRAERREAKKVSQKVKLLVFQKDANLAEK